MDRTEFIKKFVQQLKMNGIQAGCNEVKCDEKYLITIRHSGSKFITEYGVRLYNQMFAVNGIDKAVWLTSYDVTVVSNPDWLIDEIENFIKTFKYVFLPEQAKELKMIKDKLARVDEDPVATEVSVY